MPNIINILFQR